MVVAEIVSLTLLLAVQPMQANLAKCCLNCFCTAPDDIGVSSTSMDLEFKLDSEGGG